jgi:hypothetical protein
VGWIDNKGRPMLIRDIPPQADGAKSVLAVTLVDADTGGAVVLAGSTVSLDPPGPYTKLVDDLGTTLYIGEAVPGTPTNAPSWRIQRVIIGEDISKTFASNTPRFTQVWDDRASLIYG